MELLDNVVERSLHYCVVQEMSEVLGDREQMVQLLCRWSCRRNVADGQQRSEHGHKARAFAVQVSSIFFHTYNTVQVCQNNHAPRGTPFANPITMQMCSRMGAKRTTFAWIAVFVILCSTSAASRGMLDSAAPLTPGQAASPAQLDVCGLTATPSMLLDVSSEVCAVMH